MCRETSVIPALRKELPVFFIAGGDDPVGNYGKGVRRAADAFRKAGMTDVSLHIYHKTSSINSFDKNAVSLSGKDNRF